MNEVSIIINGTRYDAVDGSRCTQCDLFKFCITLNFEPCNLSAPDMGIIKVFKKSNKSFEV